MHRIRRRTRRTAPLAAFLALGIATGTAAAETRRSDPASVFKRIFSYDKALQKSSKIVVVIVARPGPDGSQAELVRSFRSHGLFPAVLRPADLTDDLMATLSPSSTVVYVTEDVDAERVKAFCAAKGVLSVTGSPHLVEAGHVSVGLDGSGEGAEIVVHLERLRAEGHQLSADLLRLARVLR